MLQANTFFVKPGSFESPSPNSALGLADLRRQSQPDNLTVAVEVKSVSATIYDDFGGFVSSVIPFPFSRDNIWRLHMRGIIFRILLVRSLDFR